MNLQSLNNDVGYCGDCNTACNSTTEFCQAGKCTAKPTPPAPSCPNEDETRCYPSANVGGDCVVSSTVLSLRQAPGQPWQM
jgi:hypothetical protein